MVNNKCSVPYCPVAAAGLEKRGKGRGNVTHFSFPKDPELQNDWIVAIRRENFKPTTSSRVCEIHFNRDDFIPPKNPSKLHVVKRLRENCIPTRNLGDGLGLEQVSQTIVNMAGVEMETVVTDGTVQYETIEQGITLRPPDVEQTIQIAEANVVRKQRLHCIGIFFYHELRREFLKVVVLFLRSSHLPFLGLGLHGAVRGQGLITILHQLFLMQAACTVVDS